MAYFLKSGNTFKVSSKEALDLHESLPVGNYLVQVDPFGNFYLEHLESFKIDIKLYGNTIKHSNRILRTFADRPNTTGVMLTGEKGSGKTLLSRRISIEGAEQGIPTIIVNSPFCGDNFKSFIHTIDQPCIMLFDEFEKVYDSEQQEQILTLLDGVFPSKKLFVITCNDKWRIDQHMRNRPGRIFYMIEFEGLDVEFINEYCIDNLDEKKYINQICKISRLFFQFNFDMLKALVEEMNRYHESPQESLAMLNAKPEFDCRDSKFNVTLQIDGVEVTKENLDGGGAWHGNPLTGHVGIEYQSFKEDSEGDWIYARFAQADLKQLDSDTGKFVFVNEENEIVTLLREKPKAATYYDLL